MVNNKVALYESIQEDRETASRLIYEYFVKKGVPTDIVQFAKTDDFLGTFQKNSFTSAFIGLNSMRNVDVAWIIRTRDEQCPIVIMSRCEDYSLESYRLEAVDYLIKPLDEEKVRRALGRLAKK